MDSLVMRLLEKQRDNRFKDAVEARAALQKILSGDPEVEVSTFKTALPPDEIQSAAEGTPSKPTTNQGKLQARGEAQMFQA